MQVFLHLCFRVLKRRGFINHGTTSGVAFSVFQTELAMSVLVQGGRRAVYFSGQVERFDQWYCIVIYRFVGVR